MKKLFLLLSLLMLTACNSNTTDVIYEFPQDFEGEFAVIYNVASAPALTKEDDYTVVKINEQGYMLTSTPTQQYGTVTDKYFYVDANGKRTAISDKCVLAGNTGSYEGEIAVNFSQSTLVKDNCEEEFHLLTPNFNTLDIDALLANITKEATQP